jgi:hypothetical protein
VSCGDGDDTAAVDSVDVVIGCESTTRKRPARRARKPMR